MHRLLLLLSALTLGGCDADAGSPSLNESARLGSLEQSQISRVVTAHMPALNACYSDSLELDPELNGWVVARFIISPSGGVSKAELVGEEPVGADLADCVLDELSAMVFPEPDGDGIVIVRYPMQLSLEE